MIRASVTIHRMRTMHINCNLDDVIGYLLFWHSSARPRRSKQMRPLGERPKPAPAVAMKKGALSNTLTFSPFFRRAFATVNPPMPAFAEDGWKGRCSHNACVSSRMADTLTDYRSQWMHTTNVPPSWLRRVIGQQRQHHVPFHDPLSSCWQRTTLKT